MDDETAPTPIGRGEIVVGVDGSESALVAVRWAAREASARARRLHIVHADPWRSNSVRRPGYRWTRAARRAQAIVNRARQLAHTIESDVAVHASVLPGSPGRVLVELSHNAAMVVVAAEGFGGFAGLNLGSVAATVSGHARCPVVVVRRHPKAGAIDKGPVVVGVDGSPMGMHALGFAFDYADRHGLPMIAVHAWRERGGRAVQELLFHGTSSQELEASEERVLAEALAGWSQMHPDVSVDRVLTSGRAVDALLDHSSRAQLTVVGSRGHSAFTSAVIGSTSQALVRYANGPIAVIHADSSDSDVTTTDDRRDEEV